MPDVYSYDGVDEAELAALCKRLASAKAKDALIKALKALASTLEGAPQDVAALGRARDEVPRALGSLLAAGSSDKDVRLYLALCVVHTLRIWAPETPYDDEPERLEVRGAERGRRGREAARARTALAAQRRRRFPWRALKCGGAPTAVAGAGGIGDGQAHSGSSAGPAREAPRPATAAGGARARGDALHAHNVHAALRPRPQAALQAVLWVIHRLQNHAAPTFQLAASVLQVFCEVRRRRWQQHAQLAETCACACMRRRLRGPAHEAHAAPCEPHGAPRGPMRPHAIANSNTKTHVHALPQTKTYYLLCDDREEVELEWFRALPDCIT